MGGEHTRHTPGPWWSEDHPFQCGEVEVPHVSIRGTLGSGVELWGLAHVCTDDEMGRANARLIAAAPTMLEALKACQSVLARLTKPDMSESVQHAWAACVEAETKARAAIAAATGGSDDLG